MPVPYDTERAETEMRPRLRPGDVVRYEPANTWCHDGWAIARERSDGRVVLVDTYWSGDGSVVDPPVLDHVCNLDDYDVVKHYAWETFAEDDRIAVPCHSGYRPLYLVRKGAEPHLGTQIANAQQRVEEAERAVRSAESTLDWRRKELAALTAAPVPAPVRQTNGEAMSETRPTPERDEVEAMVRPEGCDCEAVDICGYCGCCQHSDGAPDCIVMDAPRGMRCPNGSCGCEGSL